MRPNTTTRRKSVSPHLEATDFDPSVVLDNRDAETTARPPSSGIAIGPTSLSRRLWMHDIHASDSVAALGRSKATGKVIVQLRLNVLLTHEVDSAMR